MSERIKSRDNGLDLLRIVCMAMIVGWHFLSHGGGMNWSLGHYNFFSTQIIYAFFFVNVNCFVLISGYYLCTSKFKLKKIVNLWLQVAFYSVVIYLIVSLIQGNFEISELIKSGLVVALKKYWFFTVYFLLYLIFPFLNYAIKAMSQKAHLICCLTLVAIFSVAANFIYIVDFSQVNGGSSLIWFVTLYMIASYIRLYVPKNCIKKRTAVILYITAASLVVAERILAMIITPKLFGSVVLESFFYSKNSVLCLIASLSFFMLFRQIHIKNNVCTKLIGFFAPVAFGVYLIHDHELRTAWWSLLNPSQFVDSPFLILYFVICVVGIFLACSGIEFVRQFAFEKCRINKLVGFVCDKVESQTAKLLERIPDSEK